MLTRRAQDRSIALCEEAGETGVPPPRPEAHVEWQMAEDDMWRDEVVQEVEVGRPSPAVPAAISTPPTRSVVLLTSCRNTPKQVLARRASGQIRSSTACI